MSHHEQPRLLGTLVAGPDTGTVRMEDRYDTDIHDLWSAVSDPERLARWIGDVDGDLRLHGTFHAHFTSGWEGPGRVDVCEAPRHLQLTLSPGGADETVVEALLSIEGNRTRLVIEERGLPRAELSAYGAGWQAHVEDLAAHLDGRDRADWHDRWVQLAPVYAEVATTV